MTSQRTVPCRRGRQSKGCWKRQLKWPFSSPLSRTENLTSPTEVNAATKLISVGIVSNFPAWRRQKVMEKTRLCIKWFNGVSFFQCHFNNDQQIKQAAKTHISSHHNVKADCKRFVKSPIFGPVLCLEIFGKSALKDNKTQAWLSERMAHRLRGHWEVTGQTWSCSLWRRCFWWRVRPVAWKNTSEHKVQRSSPGYTSTQRSLLFLLPESEKNKQLWGSI